MQIKEVLDPSVAPLLEVSVLFTIPDFKTANSPAFLFAGSQARVEVRGLVCACVVSLAQIRPPTIGSIPATPGAPRRRNPDR